MTALIIYFLLAITVSFLCSLLEAVLLSLTHAHIVIMIEEGRRSGHILRKFKDKIDHPLSAILTLNTVANTVGAAGVGAQALAVFGSKWVALFSALLTFSILVFSEIIPKTLGAVYWKQFAPAAAYLIQGLIYLTYPFVIAFDALGRLLTPKERQAKVTRQEVAVAAEMGGEEGALLDKERLIIKNLLHMHLVPARDVMTPRSVLFALQQDTIVGDLAKEYGSIRFSRIPVYDQDLDDIVGQVHRFRISRAVSQGQADRRLADLVVPLQAVPMSKSVAEVLDEFILRHEHIFLVVDEYGGTAGIITLEDAIETLLGVEIVDELDHHEDMQKYALELWEKKRRRKKTDML